MNLSLKATTILSQISAKTTKLGDLRKIANEIKKDHQLAMELWSTKKYFARQLAILIMDKKLLSQELINQLDSSIQEHPENEKHLETLGKYKMSKACIYFKKLQDINIDALEKLSKSTLKYINENHECGACGK